MNQKTSFWDDGATIRREIHAIRGGGTIEMSFDIEGKVTGFEIKG